MFAVNGKDRNALFGGQRHDDVAGRDERLLIGQRDLLSGLDRGDRGPYADHPHDPCDKIFIPLHGGDFQDAVHASEDFHVEIPDPDPEVSRGAFIVHHRFAGPELADLRFHEVYAGASAKSSDLYVSLFSRNVQCLSSY